MTDTRTGWTRAMTFYLRWNLLRSWFVRHKNLIRWVLALLVLILVGKFLADSKESLYILIKPHLFHMFALCVPYLICLLGAAEASLLGVPAVLVNTMN